MIETNLLTQPDSPAKPLVLKVINRMDYSNQQFEIDDANCIIGSGDRATIQMNHPALNACHCEFVRNPVGIYVRRVGDEILVNGQVLPEAWVFPGDKIQLGSFDVEVIDVGQFVMMNQDHAVDANVAHDAVAKTENQPADHVASEDFPPVSPVMETPVFETPTARENATAREDATASEQEEPVANGHEAWIDEPQVAAPIEKTPAANAEPTEIPPQDAVVPPLAAESSVLEGMDSFAATFSKVQEQLKADYIESPMNEPENFLNKVPETNPVDDQARWLDELYESAVDEDAETIPPINPDSRGWTDDSVVPQLLQPNSDPTEFDDLPCPTSEQSKRVLDQIEGLGSPAEVEVSTHPAEPSNEPSEHESSWKQQWNLQEDTSGESAAAAAPTAFSSLLQQLEQETGGEPEAPVAPLADVATAAAVEPVANVVEAPAVPELFQSVEPEAASQQNEEPKIESVSDVLARMRAAGSLDDDEFADEHFEVPLPSNPGIAKTQAHLPGQPEDDESVQDYMNQLMQRLRKDGGNAMLPGAEGIEQDESEEPQPVVATREKADEEDLTPENPLLPGEFIPNHVERENTSTLDALRQVANQSVENAIKRSAREKSNQASLIYLGASTACLFISAVLFVLSKGVFDMAFILAVSFAIGCVGFGFMFLSINMAREKMKARKNRQKKQKKK